MRVRITGMIAALGLGFAAALPAEELERVLDRHYEALGGLDRLREVETLRITGTNRFQQQEISVEYSARRPNLLRMESASPVFEMVRVFDGERAWQAVSQPGESPQVVEMSGQDALELIRESDFDGPLIDYEEKGHEVDYQGLVEQDGSEYHQLHVTEANGVTETYLIDADEYRMVRRISSVAVEGGYLDFETHYGDFREVDGLVFPFSTATLSDGQVVFTGTIDEVEVDPELDITLFQRPG